MSTSGEISKSQKTKLSLQRKVIKPCTDLVDIIKQPSLNETCEFRSVEKMQKFFSSSESQSKEDGMRKGKSTRRNLINKNSAKAPKNEKSKKKVQIKTEMLKDTESSNAVLLNQPSCSTLNNKVTEDLEDTVKIENKIEKTKNQNEADESNVIEIDCEEDDKPGSKGKCLACGKDDIDSQDMATHLQTCLKSRFQRGKTQAESEDEVAEQGVKSADPKVEQEECFFCQICQKDLSKMNSHRRTQHLNRCIDKNEEEQNIKDLEKKALEHAKTAVLDCPMCGKPCKTENARKVHVKKCGQQLKVSTDQVLKLMKKQEEEHQMLIAAGILPKSTLSKLKGKERSSSISTKTKKTPKEPKSQFDADLQMAMAISISESKPVDKPEPKKNKKKKGPGDPTMLVAMTKEEKKRRLSMRVTNMLVPEEEECSDIDLTPEFARSGIEDKYLSQTEQIPSLWNKCSLQSENKENWKKETYYVDCLVPPLEVSKVKAGSKLKRMSEIPGRDTSFIRPKTPIKTPVVRISRNNTISERRDTQEEMLVASTQTAVVLAELAADSSQLSVPDFDCSGFCPEQPINIQPIQNTDLLGGLQKSMLSLVNSSSHADVQIHTIGGDIVFCHKVILSCRCQSILKYEEGGHIYMEDMASDAVISIMKYVYGGLVSVTQSCLSDVVKLADRFKITELQEILKMLHSSPRSTEANSPIKSESASPNKTSVESLLKQLWSDSDDEEEDDGQGHRKSGEDSGMEQELVCSQSSNSEKQKSPVMSSQMSDVIKHSLLNQITRYENKTSIENLDTESALNSSLKYVQENCDYSPRKSEAKNVKNTSLIFENDELEVYSNVSSSFEKSPEKNHPVKHLELECENSKNKSPEKRSFSPPVIADIDQAYSPEIPFIQSSQNITEKSDLKKSLSAVSVNSHVTKYIHNDCVNSEDLLEDLPLIESPRKSRQTRENTIRNINSNIQGKDSRQEQKHQSQKIHADRVLL
ncbi:structure-specific endonuclease subunit SLX4 (BTB/POZ domain-containing protein 12) [Mytilus galloprovincialis]|uniref:Structure-specific endonuclease subunit SLX4 (BTB/POZ domain-containing protein 12) n=1 Tax=Mytilus galloprovincialis TaxID=29158 RepID=A0A8B6DRI7_MYTGA|nr:structure-specific endonuclease subunit SLX4 (BTB/POZ domain-containing protein 12) [Mytilus galloprovincialis]